MNPDLLLRQIDQKQKDGHRGHLKIYFGYAAGVGKTYTMLENAHEALRKGTDVVIGYIEPHGRTETESLENGLDRLPVKEYSYKNMTLSEPDIDAALARRPALVLVDELAHTNAPGSRHAKRSQDVEELLKAGIDVWTTVNVQHLESLNDIVASITGVTVRERIQDSVFDEADQVELVDIEPLDLIERLKTGKVYGKNQARQAQTGFFTEKNLNALREIALRRCADRMNKITEKNRTSGSEDYYTDEHLLVCLSSSPTNEKIIRSAARMADALHAHFTALYIKRPGKLSAQDEKRLQGNIRLATQLGARIETVAGDDVPLMISQFARLSGVSKVVLGRSGRRTRRTGKPQIVDQLSELSPNLDIFIIPVDERNRIAVSSSHDRKFRFSFRDFGISLAFLALATGIGILVREAGFNEANEITIYILSVLLTAVFTNGFFYSLLSSVLSVLTLNYLFVPPFNTFKIYDLHYPVTILIMLAAALITSSLVGRLKEYTLQASQNAHRTRILLDTSEMLERAHSAEEIEQVISSQLSRMLDRTVIFYPEKDGALGRPMLFKTDSARPDHDYINDNEAAVATWAFRNNKHAGATTDTLGSARCLYLAVRVADHVFGTVGIEVKEPLDTEENNLVISILGEGALALENEQALREKTRTEMAARNEQLRANLLRSISHDLRTPLTSISGNAGILIAEGDHIPKADRQQLYTDIYDDSLWLISIVENLLSVTRIEDGSMRLNLQPELLDDVAAEALSHVRDRYGHHQIVFEPENGTLMARMDARLIMQVIINLTDNALKYTPDGSQITVSVREEGKNAVVSVADNGNGISDSDKEHIFEMFYTADKEADSGRSLGLGLALCRSIINAHGGSIRVDDNQPQGAVFTFTLPEAEVILNE
jgi:two-component system sensor histidine kinase KdpD